MSDNTVLLTIELLEAGLSVNGSWSHRQLKALGLKSPRKKGWKYDLIGEEIPRRNYNKFIALTNAHVSKKTRERKQHG